MAAEGSFLYLMLIIFMIVALLFGLVDVSQHLLPILNTIPGYNTINPSLAPIAGNGVISPLNATSGILAIYPSFDQYIPFIFFVIGISILASVLLLPVNSSTIAVTFLLMVITVFVSFIFSNSVHSFFTNAVFANVQIHFGNTLWLFANISSIMLLFFMLYLILVAARIRLGGGGGGGGGTIGSV